MSQQIQPEKNLHSQRMVSLIQRIKDIEQEKLILKIEVYEISKHKCITAQLKSLSKEEDEEEQTTPTFLLFKISEKRR